MLRPITICVLTLTCALAALAQADPKNPGQSKPDLNGAWMLDRDRSNVGKSGNPPAKTDELKITQHEPELRIRRTLLINGQEVERVFIYYTDGRGETNAATVWLSTSPNPKWTPRPTDETKSKTRWSGNKLVTRSAIRMMVGSHVVEYEVIEEWKLSADGKTLTQTTRFNFQQDPMSGSIYVPSNRPDDKRVYRLVSK
jgi:hypothetical protein